MFNFIYNNKYLLKWKNDNENKNYKIDNNSLKTLININLEQRDLIKLGICIEKLLIDIILKLNINLELFTDDKLDIQLDNSFINKKNKIIYISEIKSNCNLDTEKSKMTCIKLNKIENFMNTNYPDYSVFIYLINLRFLNKLKINKNIIKKFKDVNLIGLNDYFKLLDINYEFSYKTYKEFLNNIVSFTCNF